MEFSLTVLLVISIFLMIMVSFLFFGIRANMVYHDFSDNIIRIIGGSIVAGVGLGLWLGIGLSLLLPTHYYVSGTGEDEHSERFVINSDIMGEYGRKYLINLTDENVFYAAMTYGDRELDQKEQPISVVEPGYIMEIKHKINGWFEQFPEHVKTKEKGAVKWHVLTEGMLIEEYKKIGVDLNE